ncbi:MAG: sigma-70 family RNA polymerase sigma factor [Sulfuriferula sp.]
MNSLTVLRNDLFVQELRQQMVKFAALRLQDFALAEDTVHEAFVGALKDAVSFSGHSTLKTWVFAILKNKIADSLRQKCRQVGVNRQIWGAAADEDYLAIFRSEGDWPLDERTANWGNPEATLREKQFWQVLESCLSDLPPRQAKVFLLREFFELETKDICNALGITDSNLHVLLHRAKLRLRVSLEKCWPVANT